MIITPSLILFMSTLILGTTLSISSSSWFGAWIGLEMNLMSFIPLITLKNNQYTSEAALKYFLIQALGSTMIMFSASLLMLNNSISIILILSLLLKLGAAPFHFWFPQIMEGLNWIQAIILMTIQKIAPMTLISYLAFSPFSKYFILSAAMLSAIVGAIGGINQTMLRKILAFSSINHMAWMLTAILISEISWMSYFLFYSLISSSVALFFYSQQAFHFTHLINYMNSSSFSKLISSFSLLSLGGLPPFTGFLPKWFIMQEMIMNQLFFPLFILLTSTLVTLYYYLRISLSFFLLMTFKTKWNLKSNFPKITPIFLMFFNLFGLFFPSLFFFF
nr:NADH dehydrogenase subunit 2 [Neoglyphea inopinata]